MVLEAGTVVRGINHGRDIHSEKFLAYLQAYASKKNSRRILPLGSLAIPHMVNAVPGELLGRSDFAYTLKELPQPQVLLTFGLLNLKPEPSMVSM
jgi:hypothetical protein